MKKEKTEKVKQFFASRAGRGVIVLGAAMLIGLAVYLNFRWFYDPTSAIGYGKSNMDAQPSGTEQTSADAEQGQENNYFTSTTLTRKQSRDEALDVLKLVADNRDATEEAKADAQEKMSKIAVDIQNEANIETLVKAKGFEDCVAVIGEDSVSVIVRADELQAKDTAQIMTIVYEATGILPENVSIIHK